jgi:hypothetical protein
VTYKLGDFSAAVLTTYGIEARHRDEFIAHPLGFAFDVVTTAAKHQGAGLQNPPRTADEFLATVEQQRLVGTVADLRQFAEQI